MSIPAHSRGLLTFTRFLLGGGLATALHWAAMAALIGHGASAAAATAAGASFGAAANYLLQFHLTFRACASHRQSVPTYLLAAAAGWLGNLLLFSALHGGVHLAAAPAQVLTSLLVALLNFWLYSKVVFS